LAEEHEYPEFSGGESTVFSEPDDLIARLEAESDQSYAIYWGPAKDAVSRSVLRAMLLFASDGGMIAGLVVREADVVPVLSRLKNVVSAQWGMTTGDEFPVIESGEFIQTCKDAALPKIVDGELLAEAGWAG
jgi:hypothetical protein